MKFNVTPKNVQKCAPEFPMVWPLASATAVWFTVAIGGFWPFAVFPIAPYAGLTAFRAGVFVFQVIACLYPVVYLWSFAWFVDIRADLRLPLKVFAWVAPALIAFFFAGLSTLTTSYFMKFGLLLAPAVVLSVLPVGALIFYWFSIVAVARIIKPLWWLFGRPNSVVFERKDSAVQPAAPHNAPPTAASPTPTPAPSTSSSHAQEALAEKSPHYEFEWRSPTLNFEGLAGMAQLKTELGAAIAPFYDYAKRGRVADRNGILLSGPPGNGKSVFAQAIAGELLLPMVKVSGVDITSKWINESPAMLKSLFVQAAQQPCVLFIDELDSVAKDRSNGQLSEEDRKMVTALLTLLDEARSQRIVLVAATNYIELLDKAAMREGRFDYRIEVPYPDLAARIGILTGMLAKFKVSADAPTIQYVAALWERRSVAFIESTVKRLRDGSKGAKSRLASVEDFKQASREASRRSGNIPTSGARLSELALTASVRREASSLVYRLLNWERIAEQGGEPPSGVLLYGPPGTGKTNLVRALARQLEYWHVFEVNATEVLRDPRKFTDTVQLAADHRPAIVFIDEADELLRDRSGSISTGATNEILKCMDGLMGKVPEVVFMAATNNPDAIDAAALRGGRFSEKIFMGKLSGEDLVHFLGKELAAKRQVRFAPDVTPESLAARLGEVSPADAIAILKKAVNYTFGVDTAARMVMMGDIEAAMVSNVPCLRAM